MTIPRCRVPLERYPKSKTDLDSVDRGHARTTSPPLAWCSRPLLWVVALLAAGSGTTTARGQEIWDYSPYRIRVLLAVEETPRLTARRADLIARVIGQRARIWAHATWKLVVSRAPAKLYADVLYHIDRTTADQISAHWIKWDENDETERALSGDKVILVSIQDLGDAIQVRARELDCRTRFWGPTIARQVRQFPRVARETFKALADSFAPLTRIERIEGKTAFCRVRAGGLIRDDQDSPIAIHRGDVLQPWYRRNDREGRPMINRAIDWTFLHVSSTEGTMLSCSVHTGIRSPLRGRSTSRTQRYGLGIRPVHTKTELELTSTNDTAQTLTGYDIYSKDPQLTAAGSPPAKQPKTPPPYFGRSDWRGIVDIPKGELPLRIIYVKNGNNLLARLPIVPGLRPREVARMRNDDPRLMAEDLTRQIHARVIGLVTARQLIAARAEQRVKDQKIDEAKKLVEDLRQLDTRDDIAEMIESYQNRVREEIDRFPATESDAKRDRNSTQSKIDRLFDNVRALLDQFLDPQLVTDIEGKIALGPGDSAESEVESDQTTAPAEEEVEKKAAPAEEATPSPFEEDADKEKGAATE